MNLRNALLPAAMTVLLAPVAGLAAQPQAHSTPLTTGSVRLDTASGRVQGGICVTRLPAVSRGSFALNAGLNVALVTYGDGKAVDFDG